MSETKRVRTITEVQVKVREGVWIDEEWLRSAGLGRDLQIEVQPGEIRILGLPREEPAEEPSLRGWKIFQDMGRNAQPGKLRNASVDHDLFVWKRQMKQICCEK